MLQRRIVIPMAIAALVVVSVACSQTSTTQDEGDLAAELPGFEDDYEVFDGPAELADSVDVVVRGAVTAATSGRTLIPSANFPDDRIETVVLEVAVADVLRGELADPDTVYVEIQVDGEVNLGSVEAAAPDDVLVFLALVEDPETIGEGSRVEEAGAGRPDAAALYGLPPGGFVHEVDGELVDLRVDLDEFGATWAEMDSVDKTAAQLDR